MRLSSFAVVPLLALAVLRPPVPDYPWDKLEATAPDRVTERTVAGVDAYRVEVQPGDSPTRSGERTEWVFGQAAALGYEGRKVRYRWSVRFPAGFGLVPGSTWNIFSQFHETASDGCHPNLALQINAKKTPPVLRLQTRGGALTGCEPQLSPSWDFAPLQPDHWYDFVLTVRWSADPAVGTVKLDVDGKAAVTEKRTATLYPGQGVYFKQGFYRDVSSFDSVLFQTTPVIEPLSAASRRR